jgi:hypothetical protein
MVCGGTILGGSAALPFSSHRQANAFIFFVQSEWKRALFVPSPVQRVKVKTRAMPRSKNRACLYSTVSSDCHLDCVDLDPAQICLRQI